MLFSQEGRKIELGNLINVTYSANVILSAYNASNANEDSSEVLDDSSASVIQYLFEGKVSENRQNESYANEVVSMTQGLAETASTITDKFARMKELAEQAASGEYSVEEVESMQTEFEQLVGEINNLVDNTEQNKNKLFSDEGTAISISIGNTSTINIVAKNLSINGEGLDLTTDPEGVLTAIQSKVSQSSYYNEYLGDQLDNLGEMINYIEFEKNNDMGVDAEKFDMELAEEVAGVAAATTLEELTVLFDAQTNVEPEKALQLLKEEIEQAQQSNEPED
ncbi:MAG: flagellin N-terminal helical domain-containing protein [Planctomycetota bacterium]